MSSRHEAASGTQLDHDAHTVMLAAFGGPTVPAWLAGAVERGLGGVCLYGDNVDPEQGLAPLARAVAAIAPDLLVATDEEGGDVTRLHMRTGSWAPGNAALGEIDDPAVTRAVAAGIGAELRACGIVVDLAPSADVDSEPLNPVIGTRSFGPDAASVARHVAATVDGLTSQGVWPCVKHFPGHGDTRADSHIDLPVVTADRATLEERELVPFQAAVDAGVPMIMTSHVMVPALDPGRPATLSSPILTDLLRNRMGFDGLIVTDALDMAGASAGRGVAGAAVDALRAGADLLCLGPQPGGGSAVLDEAVAAVRAAVADRTLARDRLADAAHRVRTLASHRPAAVTGGVATLERAHVAAAGVATEIVARRAGRPLSGPATVVRIVTGTNPAVGDTDWGRLDVPGEHLDLTPAALVTTPPFAGEVLVVARRADADPVVRDWIAHQLDAEPSARLIELGRGGTVFPDRQDVIHTMGSSPALLGALSDALRGPA